MGTWRIPYNQPHFGPRERANLESVLAGGHSQGDGPFTKKAERQLRELTGSGHVLLTGSCTSALELCALLADLRAGDEVIMPSWTFSSTANAFVLRQATPVFVDVSPETLTLDLGAVERAITPRTRGVVVVNYAGFGPDMQALDALCRAYGLILFEDAAQAVGATQSGRHYGTFGKLGCYSFHGTKNIVAGEAGALLTDDAELALRAEILREKGTDRSLFLRGEVDKYTWRECGSSYLPSEFAAAVLMAQLEAEPHINGRRRHIWQRYQAGLAGLARAGQLALAAPLPQDSGNGHIFWLQCRDAETLGALRGHLLEAGINAVTHYVPLHSAPAGQRYGRTVGPLDVTDRAAETLLRLPVWADMPDEAVDTVLEAVSDFFASPVRPQTQATTS
ncbi:MAG: TDP-4-keto-6-deoxy-D-glucose transaminase [Moraxellaceae bacterium]|jgi:dTDP-4-amino-4,6-dideoxygalactose transaminase|nr:TDP-4-keto-6-deoxy-D-glucose transaminase [Moraxellaceae bacterium]